MIEKILICGTKSGRECDKFAIYKFTKLLAQFVRAPLIGECIANIECKIIKKVDVDSHTLFIGEILRAIVEENAFTDRWEINEVELLHHLGSKYYEISGKELIP